MTINVDAEREAVAHMLYRWDCEASGFEDEWTEADWDELLVPSEQEEYRRKAVLMMDSMIGSLTIAWQRLDESDDAIRILVRDKGILMDALGEAVSVIEGLEGQQAMPDDWYMEKLVYFRALVTSQPGHDARCTALAHHPECPDWRLPV